MIILYLHSKTKVNLKIIINRVYMNIFKIKNSKIKRNINQKYKITVIKTLKMFKNGWRSWRLLKTKKIIKDSFGS